MAGTAATVGNNGRSPLHHRLPVRVGHIGNQHVAGLYPVHFVNAGDDLHRATADLVADTATFHQHFAGFLQQITFHHVGSCAALDRFRPGLNDVDLAVIPIFGPFNIHRALVMLFNDHGLLGQFFHFRIGDGKTITVFLLHLHGFNKLTFTRFGMVNHLDGLAAEVTAQYRRTSGFQGRFVYVEFVRVHGTLHHSFTEAV